MFVIEIHDDVFHPQLGTRTLQLGSTSQLTIGSSRHAERILPDLAREGKEWRRAYILTRDRLEGVWQCSARRLTHCIALRSGYSSGLQLPFAKSNATQLVNGEWGKDASTFEEAEAWAKRQLRDKVATAAIVRGESLYAAWELDSNNKVQLLARGRK